MLKKGIKIREVVFYTVFAFYLVLLLWLLLFKNVSIPQLFTGNYQPRRTVNFIPFATIADYIFGNTGVSKSVVWNNILGNIFAFVPLGLYLQMIKRENTIKKGVMQILLISLLVEILQLAFGIGAGDVDDIILNTLGGLLGIICYQLLLKICKTKEKIKTLITIASAIVGIPLFILMVIIVVSN